VLSRPPRGLGLAVLAVSTLTLALACTGLEYPDGPPPGNAVPAPDPTEPVVEEDAPATRSLPPLPAHHAEARPDDCLLDLAELTLRFQATQVGGAEVQVSRDDAAIVETFVLPDGTPVRSVQGGCHHVGITETYVLAEPPEDLLAATREVASKVQRSEEHDPLFEGLGKVDALDEHGTLPCGDAACSLTAEGAVITLSYSFAM